MCLVHDLAEVIVGDLTPHDEIRGEEKHQLEREAMLAMAPEWVDLFDEYESASTPEAKFVKTMDKLDMGLQAIRYTEQDIDLSEFISSARKTTDETDLAYLLE
jgi:putative hydrolase of HD superfamily